MAKYIIIGGVAGGATAAARLRRNDEHATIILIEKGQYISYANCGLPYHIGGSIAEREKLLVQTPQSFGRRYNLDIRTEQEVVSIDPSAHTIGIRKADGTLYTERYDKLLLSPGASPIRPKLEGIERPGVFSLRSVEDMDAIKGFIDDHQVRRAVVVGGGFIGLEMAENLHERGIEVSIVELAPQVMAPIDYSIASFVHAHLAEQGVGLYLGQGLERIDQGSESALSLSLSGGITLETDLVLLSIGVVPNTHLAREAGLALGERGGIKVNERFETSEQDIYAVGDAIEYPHPITHQPWHNYLAGPANRQARLVADHIAGLDVAGYEGSIGTAIAKVFDLTVGTAGLAAKALQRSGIEYRSVTIHPSSHASYYPGASPLTLKLVFAPKTGQIYGAQGVGASGVDKRIDSIAQVIKAGGTIYDLMKTEQAYAPPYSSAKDPVAQAAYVASNILSDKMRPIYWRELEQSEALIVDVRTPAEYDLGHIPGAINLPVDDLRERLGELPPSRPIVVYCAVGLRGYLASNILRQRGYDDVRNLIGGYRLWSMATRTYPSLPSKPHTPQANPTQPQERHQPSIKHIDATGLCCPGPIMRLKTAMDEAELGSIINITSSDPGFVADAKAWCQSTGNTFLESHSGAGLYTATIERTERKGVAEVATGRGKTFILFSDDLDKALATFVLANGAAATGEQVSIFFTFWGLNAIKRENAPTIHKDFWGRMFGWMLPKTSRGLGLSKMNMGGLGAKMMRHLMKLRGVDSLESLRQQAIDAGVEFIACQMSMDVMGIRQEELLPNVTIGGVATYMQRAEQSGVNLFI